MKQDIKFRFIKHISFLCIIISGCSRLSPIPHVPPENMIYIPAGEFTMGSGKEDGEIGIDIGVDELPKHTVYVGGFYIDKYETTNAEYRRFLEETGNKPPLIWFTPEFQYYKIEDNHPVLDTSWYDAKRYCEWRGKRLPTEAEWEKAARGTDGRIYPWGGDKFDPLRCNMRVPDKNGNFWTLPVGSLKGGVSPYGVYDMCGNVAEWTDTWYEPYPEKNFKRDNFGKKEKVLRGGAYENDSPPFGRTADRHAVHPSLNFPMNGIRCAKDE